MNNEERQESNSPARPPNLFWSGETMAERLETLIDPFSKERIDCSAYTLSIGSEVYVSPSDQIQDPTTITIRKLSSTEGFTIPPGQFAFLITDEVVSVPDDALAFISIRSKIKFRGLVNVSGFHVDPGYRGQLTFSVFNAGPVPVHLKQGQPIFLIWYAGLDRNTDLKKSDDIRKGINPELVNSVAGELQSFAGLSKKITDGDNKLSDRVTAIEKAQVRINTIIAIVVTLAIAWFLNSFLR